MAPRQRSAPPFGLSRPDARRARAARRQDGSDGDYLDLDTADPEIDLVTVLIGLLRPVAVANGEHGFPLLMLDEHTELFIDELGDGRACLAIGHREGDAAARRQATRWLYARLRRHTRWGLRWSTDEPAADLGGTPQSSNEAR